MAYIGTQPKDVRSFGKAKFDFTATQGQTAFTGADDDGKTLGFTNGQIQVYVNGILMDDSDYSTSGSNTVTLSAAANANDIVSVVALQTDIPNSDYVPISGGTFTGDVTVGTTDLIGHATSSSGEGIALSAGSYGGFIGASRSSDVVAILNRQTDDGQILRFNRSGTTVGSIGAKGDSVFIDGGPSNYSLMLASDFRPRTSNGNSNLDATVDLGDGFARFRNLYLSGGVYLGGTGSSNYLDDYEEGTYTVYLTDNNGNTSSTSYTAYYTKIGNMVTVEQYMTNISSAGMTTGDSIYFSLPFVGSSGRYYVGGCITDGFTFSAGRTQIQARSSSSTSLGMFRECGGGVADAAVTWGEISASSSDVFMTLTYRTTA